MGNQSPGEAPGTCCHLGVQNERTRAGRDFNRREPEWPARLLATVIHQIAIGDIKDSLPNIDSSLMVLMGISQGGYLGKKLVTFGAPALYPPDPSTGPPTTTVKLRGANLGSPPDSQLLLNSVPFDGTWSATFVQFTVPQNDPATGAPWTGLPKNVPIIVSVTGQPSNSVNFTVTAPPP